jgi:hypothetical protein
MKTPQFILDAIAFIKDKFTTDTAELITKLNKLEAQIEAAIAKDTRKAQQLTIAAQQLNAALRSTDANLNAAYKMLHNVASLTA